MTAEQFSVEYENGFNRVIAFLAKKGAKNTEDLAQQAWTKAWAKRHLFRGDCEFVGWVCSIAFNCFRETFRRQLALYPLENDDRVSSDSTETAIDLERLLDKLATDDSALLRLRYIMGLRIRETSVATGLSEGAIKTRTLRALILCRRKALCTVR